MLGAGFCTQTATDTTGGIYVSDAVYHTNCFRGAGGCAVAIAKASKTARVSAAVNHRCGIAGFYTLIGCFGRICLAVAVTGNKGNHVFDRLRLYAQNIADSVFCAGAASAA